MQCYSIDWKGHYSFTDVQNQPESREIGIYGVYKRNKVLWYIGKSEELGKRLAKHIEEWSHILSKAEIKALTVCVGTIFSYEGSRPNLDIKAKQLNDIESYFINIYKPKGNAETTKKGYKGEPLFIVNTGKINKFDRILCYNVDFIKLIKSCYQVNKPRKSSDSIFG